MVRLGSGEVVEGEPLDAAPGAEVVAMIRPERVRLDAGGPGSHAGVVIDRVYLGHQIKYWIDVAGVGKLLVNVPNSADLPARAPGTKLRIGWRKQDLKVFRQES
jgi:ABC-type Fe3+/spermidine/putrescine transport system ATPase subunit